MGETVKPTRARRYSRQPSRLAVEAARHLGMRPGSVEQMIHGHSPIHLRFQTLLRAAITVGDLAAYEQLMLGVYVAEESIEERAANIPLLFERLQAADATEETCRQAYHLHKNASTRRALILATHERAAAGRRLVLALREEDRTDA